MYGKTPIDRLSGRKSKKFLKRQMHKWMRRVGKIKLDEAPTKNVYSSDSWW